MTGDAPPPGLHPVLAAAVARRQQGPQYSQLGIAEARALNLARQGQPSRLPAVESVTEVTVVGATGPLPARLYRPTVARDLPVLVYFHGGGFVAGSLDSHDSILRHLALASGIAILSVAYRLAPEHPFPAAIDDGEAALRNVLAEAGGLHPGQGSVLVGGDSAGGAIALAAAAMVEWLAGVLLFYPVADLSRIGETESYRAFGDGGAGLSLDDVTWFADLYAPDVANRTDWRCSPLLGAATRRLPPVFIATAEFDVLRSEGEALAAQLRARGTHVTHRSARGVNHGYLGALDAVPEAGMTITAAAHWIRSRLT